MSDFVPKPNTANLFYNDPGDNDKRPNWKTIGTVTFNGVEGKISGWTKTAKRMNIYPSSLKAMMNMNQREVTHHHHNNKMMICRFNY